MQCPKCGTENPDDVQICSTCGYVLKSDVADKPVAKPKTSRLAIASFVLSFLTTVAYIFAGIPAIILSIISIFRIRRSGGKLKGKPLAIAGIVISILLMSGLYLWSLDAPPIPNDYTISDLRSAPPNCAKSYELLMSISEEEEHPTGAPAIGLSAQDVNMIDKISDVIKENDHSKTIEALKTNADSINRAWENAKKGRDVINELNTFPEIADLTEPNLGAEMQFSRNFGCLRHLYQDYVYLQSVQGNDQRAVNELIESDSVYRKLSINARSTVTKFICLAGLNMNIGAANFVINNPQTSQESLELLTEHFTPLTKEQISLRSSFIFEYLLFKNILDTQLAQLGQATKYRSILLKRNSTLRAYRNFWDASINYAAGARERKEQQFSVWPSIYPDCMPKTVETLDGDLAWQYKYYNPGGCLLTGLFTLNFGRMVKFETKIKVQDDLLQIVLNKRLGNEVSLKARAYSDEYIIDTEKKIIFSPGPDGKADTKDDIKLIINPEVLNLTD